jgi:hypothetical protein
MIRIILIVAAFGLLVGLASPMSNASAAGRGDTPEARQACTPDALRLCDKYIQGTPDAGRIAACLKRSKRQLSVECRRVIFGR